MTNIDLTKSQIILPGLLQAQLGLSKLNPVDISIKKVVNAISEFMANPTNVAANEIRSVVTIAQEISLTYNKETEQLTASLDKLLEEIEYLELSHSLTPKHAKLISKVDKFYKLATGK